jgi:hypothetical protein
MNFADGSIYLISGNVWNEVFNFVDRLTALCFTASNAVHAWEFVYDFSAMGNIYQLH